MKRLYDKALMDQIAKVYGNEATFLSEFSRALLDIIREGLIRDGQVRLHQFGTFKLKWMNSRNGVNPSTGKKIIIQGRPRVIFTPAKSLKEKIEPNPPALIPLDTLNTAAILAEETSAVDDAALPETSVEYILEKEVGAVVPENTSITADEVVDETSVSEPEEVVANIQDEIEVLEQVVDILKTDSKADNTVPEHREEKVSSKWLDTPVVDQIKEISELQYFQPTKEDGLTLSANENTTSDVVQTDAALNHSTIDDLDINLDEIPETDNSNNDTSGKPWFAVAAAVLVLLAAGILFNGLWPTSTEKQDVSFLYSYYTPVTEPEIQIPDIKPEHIDDSTLVAETVTDVEQEDISAIEPVVEDVESAPIVKTEPELIELNPVVEEESIVVSSEQYDEVKRASAEETVYFLETKHKLIDGDSLWRLAKKNYVNPFYWPHIYQANRNKIDNPDRVKIGRVVMLPTLYGQPEALTKKDKRNIAMGYYFNYLYHKQKGNPYAYFSLIGVDKFDAGLLIEFKEEIERSDVNNLALLSE